MKALITGAAGFVGKYLAEELLSCGWEVCASKLKNERLSVENVSCADIDVTDSESIKRSLESFAPDVIFHLAAQSSVGLSWEKPSLTVEINVCGTINLLEAVREVCPKARVILIGSSEEYGRVTDESPFLSETSEVRPCNIYAVSRAAQNMTGKIYSSAYGLDIVMTRSFNHIGPGQQPQFVMSDFCRQTALIEKGLQPPVIKTGNIDVSRDFSDVRDIVRAYIVLAKNGVSGETYNTGSGKLYPLRKLLDIITGFSEKNIAVETDASRYRPAETPALAADISKLSALGWQPRYDIKKTLHDIYCCWLNNV